MSKPLHIVLFDGSLTTTTFITRLAQVLATRHQVSFIGFGGTPKNRSSNIGYFDVGTSSNSFQLFVKSLGYAFQLLLKKGHVGLVFKTFACIVTNQKDALKQQNVDSVLQLLQPDILHIQWPSLLSWCETAIATNSIKVVLSQRGYQNNVRPFVSSKNMAYLKSMYPKLDGFHSVSKSMTFNSDLIYKASRKIDSVVYTGFNLEGIVFQSQYTKQIPLRIVSIGRPHWKKGYHDAINAMVILKQKGLDFTYEIIGARDNEELVYLIAEHQLTTEVQLLGKVPQQEVYKKMRNSSLFLLPSLEEGLPNVMVEAMALGLPVIATNCGGVGELLDETTGTLIPTRDAKRMADALVAFTETPLEIINSRRLEARKRVEARHGVEEMVLGMEGLYAEVLGVN